MAYHADAADLADKEILSWEGFGAANRELAQAIADSGFVPDVLIVVARGGLCVAGGLSYALGAKLSGTVNVEFYTDVATTLPDPVLLAPHLDTEAIAGKKLLVVDDVADSGRTLVLVVDLLRELAGEVRSAVLYAKPSTRITPDYVWRDTADWIVFPWSSEPPVQPAG